MTEIWPTELRIKNQGSEFEMILESGEALTISAELLRVESPSAEVKGHGPGQETLVFGKRKVTITKATPIGNYAVRLFFNDGHDTGLFTWTYLAELGRNKSQRLADYCQKLEQAGLPRDLKS
jgi:DUF971 family protein